MYKIRIVYNKKGNKKYCVYRDGKLKYCSDTLEDAQRVCQMFHNYFRWVGVAI